jgi:type II secretory pathway pseudopilin PulG
MTLIEVLIALVILLITSLAMMQTALLAMQTNMTNSLRDEALSVADARMNELRNERFSPTITSTLLAATPGTTDGTVERKLRAASVTFTRTLIIADINSDPPAKQVTVTVTWSYRNQPYTHSITTIIRRQEV